MVGVPKSVKDFLPNFETLLNGLFLAVENEDFNLLLAINNAIHNEIQENVYYARKNLTKKHIVSLDAFREIKNL